MKLLKLSIFSLALAMVLLSCKDDNGTPQVEVPETYAFERDGASSVSYSGQTIRLDMLSELKTYISTAHTGTVLEEQKLLDMYANANARFSTDELNNSGKQLESKTYEAEVAVIKALMTSLAAASEKEVLASEGNAGFISRGSKDVLVNEKGHEYLQFIEKGLMGSCFYDQILNGYLSDDKIGSAVDNETIVDGKNYTAMEHHWDEAFGYFGVPVDFPNGDPILPDAYDRFWGKYTNSLDAQLGVNALAMNAYKKGRAAIVAKQYEVRDSQRDILLEVHELVAAGMAIHYLNEAKADLNDGGDGWQGNFFHHLSEAYQFVKAIQYAPNRKLDATAIDTILNENLGTDGDFWTIENASGINDAIDTIGDAYADLTDLKDVL